MAFLKNFMNFSLGAASLTRDKIEEWVDEAIKRGEVAASDRAETIDELQKRAQKATADLKGLIAWLKSNPGKVRANHLFF